jgi:hypothetical protein
MVTPFEVLLVAFGICTSSDVQLFFSSPPHMTPVIALPWLAKENTLTNIHKGIKTCLSDGKQTSCSQKLPD